ncbi:accessory Sec system protein Asp1 [Streptococcus cuniculipharyngis]|uniref:Accessory Sec system protein Asp1 n=1 Tax=Streptococcus cuniculipharyngis TaxID=1562651 RepID=A0A5C5SFW2_9STRE|nr:accessory Sec system protein Asp1 [Streptococcus cuniculipharyngis]TWS98895.1 accessory Sec system protein Asp1 [Streptococcus cuniculipharyngis]
MFYVVPAWYAQKDSEDLSGQISRPWYEPARYLDDDMTGYLRLLQEHGQESQLILLSYLPQLDQLLQEEALYGLAYWSVFDVLQDTVDAPQRFLSFRDLLWPERAEFVYTPFLVQVRLDNRLFARVEFAAAGNLLWIDYFNNDQLFKRLVYDARGFLSSQITYQAGLPYCQDYYNLAGSWQFRQYLQDSSAKLVINPVHQDRFKATTYASIKELVVEKLTAYLTSLTAGQKFLVAAEARNLDLLQDWFSKHQVALSFWEDRLSQATLTQIKGSLTRAKLLLSNRPLTWKKLENNQLPATNLLQAVGDKGTEFGKSQELAGVSLYLQLDGLDPETRTSLLKLLLAQAETYSGYDVILVSQEQDARKREALKQWLNDYFPDVSSRLQLRFPASSFEQVSLLQQARLLIDLSPNPNLKLQAQGLNLGLPQIVACETPYVDHLKNAYIIHDLQELPQALAHYLTRLDYWHQALADMVMKQSQYQGLALIHQLKAELDK